MVEVSEHPLHRRGSHGRGKRGRETILHVVQIHAYVTMLDP